MLALSIEALIKIALMLFAVMTAAAYLVLLERWMCAWMQGRLGPNRVGIPLTKIRLFGLGQPLADGLKFIAKQEYTPGHVDKALFTLAPVVILTSALAVFAVIPVGSLLPANLAFGYSDHEIPLVIAPGVNVGLLFVFALSSLAVYGVILGGWASNSKYSFIGGLRSSAQLIAYELPLGLGILGVVLMSHTLDLSKIIETQAASGVWFVAVQPLGFLIFLVAAFAEAARLPFDLPEAEQELVGGYHTEYSGIRLLMYLVAEFLHMVTAAFLIVILFFGGWHLWGVTGGNATEVTWFQGIARIVVLMTKVMGVILFFMLVRWSWPRFRFDQLMTLAWKVMLPLGLLNMVIVAVVVEYRQPLESLLGAGGFWKLTGITWIISIGAVLFVTAISPSRSDNRPRLYGVPDSTNI